MSKKQTKKRGLGRTAVSVPAPKVVPVTASAAKVAAQPDKIPKYAGENHTSPTILRSRELSPRGAPARRRFGCMESAKKDPKTGRVTKRFTGERCKGTISPDAEGRPQCSTQPFRDAKCSSNVYAKTNSPCATGRFENLTAGSRCPVQFAWLEGKPVLRLCSGPGEQGELVRVEGVKDAKTTATKLCEFWAENGSWFGIERVAGARAIGLGRAKRRKTRKKAAR